MSCDQQATIGISKFKLKTKMFKFPKGSTRYPEGFIVGFAGTVNEFMDVVDYFANSEAYKKAPAMPNTQGLVLTDKGKIYYFSKPDKWVQVDAPHYSIGSGSSFALGAMENKASTKEAVRVAMKHDIGTGFGVKTLAFK